MLLCVFFIITPLQYLSIGLQWYPLYNNLIPLFAFLLIPILSVVSGDYKAFLERVSKIQWGLMICVYCVSHVPALLGLNIPGYENQNTKLLFFFVIVVQISDVLQYVWGKLFGKRKIAPNISPNKTWEGFIGGVCCATLIGTLLWWVTPFSPWQAAGISLAISLTGFAGGLTMSAIKRDCGVKNFGTIIEGHGGVLDRIDSICFAAPVFYQLTKHIFT
jgi:phosphatidate cytidylyltransferase